MGLISSSLNLDIQKVIRNLSTEIVQTMRRASACLDVDTSLGLSHRWNYHCYFWFGSYDPQMILKVKKALDRMATLINLHPFHISAIWPGFTDPDRIAAAIKPLSGF